ncbi:MAG: dockerin type I repeat-containing protein, partial [Candidatus Omnitrophota bacterium]
FATLGEEFAKAALRIEEIADLYGDAETSLRLFEVLDMMAEELADAEARCQALVDSGYTSQAWIANASVVSGRLTDVEASRLEVLEKASVLKAEAINEAVSRYKTILDDIVNETEVANISDSRGLLTLAEKALRRITGLVSRTVALSGNAAENAEMADILEQVKSGLRTALDQARLVRKNVIKREGFDTNLASFIGWLGIVGDATDELRQMSGAALVDEDDLKDILAIRMMVQNAYDEFEMIMDASDELLAENPGNEDMLYNYDVVESFGNAIAADLTMIESNMNSLMTILESRPEGLDLYPIATDFEELAGKALSVAGSASVSGAFTTDRLRAEEYIAELALRAIDGLNVSASTAADVFTEDFEFGTEDYWNEVNLTDSSLGVTASPERCGLFDGKNVLELRGDEAFVVKDLGDLTGAGQVTISFYGAVSSLDYNYYYPEVMEMDFYGYDSATGTNKWFNGVARFTRSDNDKGYKLKTYEVPEERLCADNRIRFSARANSKDDYFCVDNVRVTSTAGAGSIGVEELAEASSSCEALAGGKRIDRVYSEASEDAQALMDIASADEKAMEASYLFARGNQDMETLVYLGRVLEEAGTEIALLKEAAESIGTGFTQDDIDALDGYIGDAEEYALALAGEMPDGRAVIDGDSPVTGLVSAAAMIDEITKQAELAWSMKELRGFGHIAERLLDISEEEAYRAMLTAAEYSTSIMADKAARFAGETLLEDRIKAEDVRRRIDIAFNANGRNASLLEKVEACLDLATAAEVMMDAAADIPEAYTYVYIAEMAKEEAGEAAVLSAEVCKLLPLDEKTARANMQAIIAGGYSTEAQYIACAGAFETIGMSDIALEAAGTYSTSVDGDELAIEVTDPLSGHLMILTMKNRKLVSIEDTVLAETIEAALHNTVFRLASDGSMVWTVERPDGSVIRVRDNYTGVYTGAYSTAQALAGLPEWSRKIMDFAEGIDLSELEGEHTESFRDFVMVARLTEAVQDFFAQVVQAYQYSLMETLDQAQKEHLEYYAPLVRMLLAVNPLILLTGGIGAISSWLVSQGSKITNCAIKALLGYFEGAAITAEVERLAAAAIISDIAAGLITPAVVGDIETSLFTMKAIAAAKGVTLHGVETDMASLSARDTLGHMPAIAVIEERFMNHIVLVESVTAETVTYVSGGVQFEEPAGEFGKKFLGYILSTEPAMEIYGEKALTDADMMAIYGSEASILAAKTDNLVDYLNTIKGEMTALSAEIKGSVSSSQAMQHRDIAAAILNEIQEDADYIGMESQTYPGNSALSQNAADAQAIRSEAESVYGDISGVYADMSTKEAQGQAWNRTSLAHLQSLQDSLNAAMADPREATNLLSYANQAVASVANMISSISAHCAKYPANTVLKGYLDSMNAVWDQMDVIVNSLQNISDQLVGQKYLVTAQFDRADINGDRVVDAKDIADFNAALAKIADLDGDGKLDELDKDKWSVLLDYIDYSQFMNRSAVLRADMDGDNDIDVTDVALLNQMLRYRVDVNQDGKVDELDATELQKAIDGSISVYGAELTRKEFFYNPEKAGGEIDYYVKAAEEVRNYAVTASSAEAARVFADMAEDLAAEAESIADGGVDGDYSTAYLDFMAARARQLQIEAEGAADRMESESKADQMSRIADYIVSEIDHLIGQLDDQDMINGLEAVKSSLDGLDFTALMDEEDENLALKVLAVDRLSQEVYEMMRKESPEVARALYDVFTGLDVVEDVFEAEEEDITALLAEAADMDAGINAIISDYFGNFILDNAGLTLQDEITVLEEDVQDEYELRVQEVKDDAMDILPQVQSALGDGIQAGDLGEKTMEELETLLDTAMAKRAEILAHTDTLLKMAWTMDANIGVPVGGCYETADSAATDIDNYITDLIASISDIVGTDYDGQEQLFTAAQAAYNTAIASLQGVSEESDLASAQTARDQGLDAVDEIRKLGRLVSIGASYTTFVDPLLSYRLDLQEELTRVEYVISEILKGESEDYYDGKFANYITDFEDLQTKRREFDMNYANRADDDVYRGLRRLRELSRQLLVDAESASTTAIIAGLGGEYALKKLYESASQQAASMEACRDLIAIHVDAAQEVMSGEGSDVNGDGEVSDLKELLIQLGGMPEQAEQLQTSAYLAEYALNKALAIATGDPDNEYFQKLVNGLSGKVADLRNVADLMNEARTVMENTNTIENMTGAMDAYNTFISSAVTGAIAGGDNAYAYLAAIEIAEQAFKEAKTSSISAAREAEQAAGRAAIIAASIDGYAGTFDTILGPSGTADIMSLLKERSGTAVLQAQSTANKTLSYAISPETAEQEENSTWDQALAAEVEFSYVFDALEEFLDADTLYSGRETYESAVVDYESAYYGIFALTPDADGDGEDDEEYTAAVNLTSDLQAAESDYSAKMETAKAELQAIEGVITAQGAALKDAMQEADELLMKSRQERDDALNLEKQLELAENRVLVLAERLEALEKVTGDLNVANGKINNLAVRADAASRAITGAAESRLGEEYAYGSRINLDRISVPAVFWASQLPDLEKLDPTIKDETNAEKAKLWASGLASIANSAYLKMQGNQVVINQFDGKYQAIASGLSRAQEQAASLRAQAASARSAFEDAENSALAEEAKVMKLLGQLKANTVKYAAAYGEYDGAWSAWIGAKRALEINKAITQGNPGRDSLMSKVQDAEEAMDEAENEYLIIKAQADISHDPADIEAMNGAYEDWQDKIDEWEDAVEGYDNYITGQMESAGIDGLYEDKEAAYAEVAGASQAYMSLAGDFSESFGENEALRRQYAGARSKARDIRIEYDKRDNANIMAEESASLLGETVDDSARAVALMSDTAAFINSYIPQITDVADKLRTMANADKMDYATQVDASAKVKQAYTKAQMYEQIADRHDADLYGLMMNVTDAYSDLMQKEKRVTDAEVSLELAQAEEEGGDESASRAEDLAQSYLDDATTACAAAQTAYDTALAAYEDKMTKLKNAYGALSGDPDTTGGYEMEGGFDFNVHSNVYYATEYIELPVYEDGALAECLSCFIPDYMNGSLWGDGNARDIFWELITDNPSKDYTWLEDQKEERYLLWKEALAQGYVYETTKRRYSMAKSLALVQYTQSIDNVAGAMNSVRHELADVYRQYGKALEDQVVADERLESAQAALDEVPVGDEYNVYRAELAGTVNSAQRELDAATSRVGELEGYKGRLETAYGEVQDKLFEAAGDYVLGSEFFDKIDYDDGLRSDFEGKVGEIFSDEGSDMASSAADIMKYGYQAESLAASLVNLAQAKALGATVNLTEIQNQITELTAGITAACAAISSLPDKFVIEGEDSECRELTYRYAKRSADEAKRYADHINDMFNDGETGAIEKLNDLKTLISGIGGEEGSAFADIVEAGDLANRVRDSVAFIEELYKLTQKALCGAVNALCAGVVADSRETYLVAEAKAKAYMAPVEFGNETTQWQKYYDLLCDQAEEMMKAELGEHLVNIGSDEYERALMFAGSLKDGIMTLNGSKKALENRIKAIDMRITNATYEIQDYSNASYPGGIEGEIMRMKNEQKVDQLERKKDELEKQKASVQAQLDEVKGMVGGLDEGGGGTALFSEEGVWNNAWINAYKAEGDWKVEFDATDNQYRIDTSGNPPDSYDGLCADYVEASIRAENVKIDVMGHEVVRGGDVSVGEGTYKVSWKDNMVTQLWLDADTRLPKLPDPQTRVWMEEDGGNNYLWVRDWGTREDGSSGLVDEEQDMAEQTVELSCEGLKSSSTETADRMEELAQRVMGCSGQTPYWQFESKLASASQYEKAASDVSLKALAIHDDVLKLAAKIDDAAIRNSQLSYSSQEAALRKNITANLLAAQTEGEMKAALGLGASAGDSGAGSVFQDLLDEIEGLQDSNKGIGYNMGIMSVAEKIALRAAAEGAVDGYQEVRSEMITRKMAEDARRKYLDAERALRGYEATVEKQEKLASSADKAKAALKDRYQERLELLGEQIEAYEGVRAEVKGRLTEAKNQRSSLQGLKDGKKKELDDLLAASEIDYIGVTRVRNEYDDLVLALKEAEELIRGYEEEEEVVQRELDELESERSMNVKLIASAGATSSAPGETEEEPTDEFRADLEAKLAKAEADWTDRKAEWEAAFSAAAGSGLYGDQLNDQVLGASAAKMQMAAGIAEGLKAFIDEYKVTFEEEGGGGGEEYYLIEPDIAAMITESIKELLGGVEEAQELIDVTGGGGTYGSTLQTNMSTVESMLSGVPDLEYPPVPVPIDVTPSADDVEKAKELISEKAADLSVMEFGTQDTVRTSIADMKETRGLGLSSVLCGITDDSTLVTTEKATEAAAIKDAREKYNELQSIAQGARELAFTSIRTQLPDPSLVDIQAEIATLRSQASAKQGEVTSALSGIGQDSEYYSTKNALEKAATKEVEKAQAAEDEISDALDILAEELRLGEWGALAKTATYSHGHLVRESMYDGIKGQEMELVAIDYYTGTTDVKGITVSEYDDDEVLTKQTRYFRDYFVLESKTEYFDAAGLTQFRGKELPVRITTYYDDGVTEESVTVNFYDTDKRGLDQSQRVSYDRIPGGPTVSMFTDIDYTPQEPGRGRIDRIETYDLEGAELTLGVEAPVLASGTLVSEEDYYYALPDVGSGLDAMGGLFAKEALERKVTTTHLSSGGTEETETLYSGLRGAERITGVSGENIGVSYEYSGLMNNLRQTVTHHLDTDIKRTSVFTGYEGEEKVVTISEYRRPYGGTKNDEELASVSRYYYSTDGALLRRVVDFYEPYGSPLFGKRPVSRTVYEYDGEPGHERIVKETGADGVTHYYNYFLDADTDKGLITAITTNPEKFDPQDLPSFEAQVVTRDLMYGVYQDPNYKPSTENNVVFMDKDGVTLMAIDRFGTVQKFEYKKDVNGKVERDDKGRIMETYVYTPDGAKVTKGPDGFKTEETGYDSKGRQVTYTYTYDRDNTTGDVVTDPYGNPVRMEMEWNDWEYEYTLEDEYDEVPYETTRVYQYGVLFSEERKPTVAGYYSKWYKGADGVWRLKVSKNEEDMEDPDSFTLHVDSESGAIDSAWAWEEGSGEKARVKLMPDEFGNYDFFAQKLEDGWMVHVYKGRSIEDKVYTGMTLKYEDENGGFGDLIEFNDRISDMVTLWKDEQGADKSLKFGDDYGQGLYFEFSRAPVSEQELIYYEMREQMDLELEGGETDAGEIKSMEELMGDVQDKLTDLMKEIEVAKLSRDAAVDKEVKDLTEGLFQYMLMPERGDRIVTYEWAYNTSHPHKLPNTQQTDWGAVVANQINMGLTAMSMGLFGVAGATTGLTTLSALAGTHDTSSYTGGLITPVASAFAKSKTLKITGEGIVDMGIPRPGQTSEQVSLEKFKEWIKAVVDYASGQFAEDIAAYINHQTLEVIRPSEEGASTPPDLTSITPTVSSDVLNYKDAPASFLDWGPRSGKLAIILKGTELLFSDEYAGDTWVQRAVSEVEGELEAAFDSIVSEILDFENTKYTKFDEFLGKTDIYTEAPLLGGDATTVTYAEKARRLFKYMVDQKKAHALNIYNTRQGNEMKRLAQLAGNKKKEDTGDKEEDVPPVWIPGATFEAGGSGGGGGEEEKDDYTKNLEKWMEDIGRSEYNPGMLDRYGYDLDKVLWQFEESRRVLAKEIARKEKWLDEKIFSAENELSDDKDYDSAPDIDEDTYLNEYIKENFWDEGFTFVPSGGDQALYAAEAQNIEQLGSDLIDIFEDLMSQDHLYNCDKLEHLKEYVLKADLYKRASMMDPRYNMRKWDSDDWDAFIDPEGSNIPEFYSDYGNQKANLAAYAIFRYMELAAGFIENLENIHEKHDVANIAQSLVYQIRQYNPDPASKPSEKMDWAGDYSTSSYESLAAWKSEVLNKLNTFTEDGQAPKDYTYSLGETLREAASLKCELAISDAGSEISQKNQVYNNEYSTFLKRYFEPAKVAADTLLQEEPTVIRTDVVMLEAVDGSSYKGGKHFILRGYKSGVSEGTGTDQDLLDCDAWTLSDTFNTESHNPEKKKGEENLVVYMYNPVSSAWVEYNVVTVASYELEDDEKRFDYGGVSSTATVEGKFYNDGYIWENYTHASEARRDVLDLIEEPYFREYASEIGIGGAVLAELYGAAEKYYAERLQENAEAFSENSISEEQYIRNIFAIKQYRESHRELLESYLLGGTEPLDLSNLEEYCETIDPTDEKLYGILKN